MMLTFSRTVLPALLAALAIVMQPGAGEGAPVHAAEPAVQTRLVWDGTLAWDAKLIGHFGSGDSVISWAGSIAWHLVWSADDKNQAAEESTLTGTASRTDSEPGDTSDCSGNVIPLDPSLPITANIPILLQDKDEKTVTMTAYVPGWRGVGNVDACYGGGMRPPVAVEPDSPKSFKAIASHDFAKDELAGGFASATDAFKGSHERDIIAQDGYRYTYKTTMSWSGKLGVGAGNYVAMGDSYGAGVGNEPYDRDACARSDASYAQILNPPLLLKHVACSGATTASMTRQFAALTKDTELVTLFIGGNDIGFSGVLSKCIAASVQGVPCWASLYTPGTTVAQFVTGQLDRLRRVLPAVYQTIRGRAPNARILVLGYPNFMAAKAGGRCIDFTYDSPVGPLKLFDAIKPEDVPWLHDRIEELNLVIDGAVIDSGVDAEYIDTGREFAGHDLCQPAGASWFFPIIFGGPRQFTSLHPNGSGQQAIARAINGQLGMLPPRSTHFHLRPGQSVARTVPVKANVGSITFSATWTDGRFTLSIAPPGGNGAAARLAASSTIHKKGAGFDVYQVTNPRPGPWRITIRAVTGPADGVEVSFRTLLAEPDCVVPVLAGISIVTARSKLKTAHCTLGLEVKESSRTVPPGRVIRALVPAGAILPPDASADVVVSSGK